MKKCAQALRFICDNLDADLASPRCIEIRHHLSECPDCSAYLDSMKKTVALYRRYTAGKVPPAVRKLLTSSLKREQDKTRK
jgi:predicted anti-sigma-YlaC factor YlaD